MTWSVLHRLTCVSTRTDTGCIVRRRQQRSDPSTEPAYTIADISKQTGLSYDTIRYYEKIGLLPPIERKHNGQREYSQRHLDRLIFVLRLKRTNMPLKKIKQYLVLTAANQYEACYQLLHQHKCKIESEMAEMQATLDIVAYKLENFMKLMHDSQ
ncbi:MerR family transcriptional regulator [Alicyclobacillus suci]|uniref:MerR family transcriptional regulator n=1 Tax=Alicyclobacillus suci TaxID=2816080 RepID=UPI001A9071CE